MRIDRKSSIIGEDCWEFEANIEEIAKTILQRSLSVDFREERGRPDIKSVKVVDGNVLIEFSTYKNTEQQ